MLRFQKMGVPSHCIKFLHPVDENGDPITEDDYPVVVVGQFKDENDNSFTLRKKYPSANLQEGILVDEDGDPLIDENGDPITEYNYYLPKNLSHLMDEDGNIIEGYVPTPSNRFCLEYYNSFDTVLGSSGSIRTYMGEEEENEPYKFRDSYNRTIINVSAELAFQLEYDRSFQGGPYQSQGE